MTTLQTSFSTSMTTLQTSFSTSMTLEFTGINPDVLEKLAGFAGKPRQTPQAVLIETLEPRPVYEPRPPAPFRPRRSLWARLSGANAAAERSWRGKYAAYRVRHDAWVAAGRPLEETVRVRRYFPSVYVTTTDHTEVSTCTP